MSNAFLLAVAEYTIRAPRDTRGKVILTDATRQAVAELLHASHPDWHEAFNLDAVERAVWKVSS